MGRQTKAASKAYQVDLSVNAQQNIDEITGYIAFINHEPLNAIKVGSAIFNTIDRIAQTPYAFRECEEIPTKTRMYRRAVCLSWLIVYKVIGDTILILGIIHRSRKPSMIKKLQKNK
jgi:plasmid stabilization system protein ParE